MSVNIICADVMVGLQQLPSESIHCVVTSPPYFGLRDYGVAGQIGLEKTPQEYVAKMVAVFREVRRVLRTDGTCWINLGDSYASAWVCNRRNILGEGSMPDGSRANRQDRLSGGLKEKDLCGIPWRVAFALQDDGWWLRQDIIWSKPNPMPESVTDRCTKAHEYLFLLTKSARYYFDAEAIKEPLAQASIERLSQDVESQQGNLRVPGKTNGPMKAVRFGGNKYGDDDGEQSRTKSGNEWKPKQPGKNALRGQGQVDNRPCNREGRELIDMAGGMLRNKRSVWEIATSPYSEAHFATFPPKLVEPCILSGCPQDGKVLDPFSGAGTTAMVAARLGRNAIGIELNPEYVELSERRLHDDAPLFSGRTPCA